MKKFTYFSVATKPHPNLDLLISLSKHFDLDVQILGKNDKYLTEWGVMFGRKNGLYHQALKSVHSETIVLLSDSYDFLPLATKEEIIEKFLKINCDIVYNAEYFCHPKGELWTEYDRILPENKEYQYRYLNSGMILGRAGKILELFNHYPYSESTDDQLYHTLALLDIRENKTLNINIKLDVKHEISFAMAGNIGKLRFDTEQLRFQCWDDDSWPILIHCNGSIGETRPLFDKWNEYHRIPITKYDF